MTAAALNMRSVFATVTQNLMNVRLTLVLVKILISVIMNVSVSVMLVIKDANTVIINNRAADFNVI